MNRYVFGMHRGGSSVMGRLAASAARISNSPLVRLGEQDKTLPEEGPRGAAKRVDTLRDADGLAIDAVYAAQPDNWRAHSGLFAPIRRADLFPPEVFADGDRAVLLMRDPRDCMVSGYYGFLRLHAGGLDNPEQRRRYEMGVDTYVLTHMLPRYARVVDDYMALQDQLPALQVLHYEHMVTDFPAWLDTFLTALDLPDSVRLRDRLRLRRISPGLRDVMLAHHAGDFTRPSGENIDTHKRQMLPGDHVRKLAPDTIATINAAMAPALARFGYAGSPPTN